MNDLALIEKIIFVFITEAYNHIFMEENIQKP